MPHAHIASGGRYPILRSIAILWLVSALLALAGGVYQAVSALVDARAQEVVLLHSGAMSSRVMAFFIWLAATFFVVILNIAVAELIKLAIDVEHNTRMTSINVSTPASSEPVVRTRNGRTLEEESAEAALIRGH